MKASPDTNPRKKRKKEKPVPTITEALKASEIRYRRLFESAKDGILILDAKTGMIDDVNPFLIELLGYSKEAFIKKTIWEIGFFKDIFSNKEKFLELQKKEYVRYDDLPLETSHGKKINVEFVSNVYKENKQKVIQCNIRDITERKKKDRELIAARVKAEESDRLKSAFLANMSHEIRTPMNGILGFTELLKTQDLPKERQTEFIDLIERSGKRMLNIINDIISISKVEAGQMNIFFSTTNINDQIEYIYTFFKPEAEKKGLKFWFKNSLPAKSANINTDREKVNAILINLVKNAIKFTDSGFIEFGYEIKDKLIEFFVTDTGRGVPIEQETYIFDRFRQGNESTTRNFEGAGLGLAISRAYAEILGGKIWIDYNSDQKILTSAVEAKGSTFRFSIPYNSVKDINNPAIIFDAFDVMENVIRKLKILIVEDDEISLRLFSNIAGGIAKELLKINRGAEAVELCRNNPDIDLVLMDIKMHEMDGYEATRQIRIFNSKVIIIAVTAYGLNGDREKALEAGCSDYISKPVNPLILKKLIYKHFYNYADQNNSNS